MRLLVPFLALTLAACATTPEAPAPTARADGDLVLFEAANCETGRVIADVSAP